MKCERAHAFPPMGRRGKLPSAARPVAETCARAAAPTPTFPAAFIDAVPSLHLQAAEIAAAERELQSWQQRCFPCLPALPGEDDEQPSGGADQAACTSSSGSKGCCTLPEIKGAQGRVADGAGSRVGSGAGGVTGGFAPYGARGHGALGGRDSPGAGLGGKRGGKMFIGPDGKPELLKRG